ncbi:hypothetical protein K7432_016123 [Basidiobolus ranarum]|uniref:Jacalin-type lectin domain-containing protein n=1 Tax=Basidiobolus ranarum TaxID=34480 RepID=A0ABR2WF76_9FUNG
MDAHYDPQQHLILGHTALGGGSGHIRLGIFGSHAVHSWPKSLEEVVPAFTDERCTEEYLANDSNECGVYYKCLNVAMGAFLHEVGHCLTLAHSASGIMSRGFNDFNKSFVVKEGNKRPILPNAQDEAGSHWHRTDVVRFRYHPCFRLPTDPYSAPPPSEGASFLAMDNGVLIKSPAGLSMIEYHINGRYSTHVEFVRDDIPHPPEIMIEINEIYSRLNIKSSDKLRIEVVSKNEQINTLEDIQEFVRKGTTQDKDLGNIFKSMECGTMYFQDADSFSNIILPSQGHQLVSVRIYFGAYIDGISFKYTDGREVVCGKTGGGDTREISLDRDDWINRVVVNHGAWIDGIEVITNKGKTTGWCGGKGGQDQNLQPPPGYSIVGMFGSAARWCQTMGIMYKKF